MSQPIDNSFLPTLFDWWIFGFDYLSNSNQLGALCPTTVTNNLIELLLTCDLGFASLSIEVNVRQFTVNPEQNLVIHQI